MNAFAHGSDQLTEGWLTKEAVGKTGNWRRRYFLYRNNALYYYGDKPKSVSEKAKGIFEVTSRSIVRDSACGKNWAFELVNTKGGQSITLRMAAENSMQKAHWMAVLREGASILKGQDEARGGDREHKYEGFLTKRAMGSGRNWKKRWFVLKAGRLAYYESRPTPTGNERPKGVMELTPDTTVIIFKDSQVEKPNTFEVTARKLVLTASADSREAMLEWVEALDQQILLKSGITGPGAVEVAKWLRKLGLNEYARHLIDAGLEELHAVWAMDSTKLAELSQGLEMSRLERDLFEEGLKVLKKGKQPKTHKVAKVKPAVMKNLPKLFDPNPPPPGAATRLYCWGDSSHNQLGVVTARTGEKVHTPTFVDALKGKNEPGQIACGYAAMACITKYEDANVYTWGVGPLGLGAGQDKLAASRPHLCVSLRDIPVRQVTVGESHMVCCTNAGDVYSWGGGANGQLGLGPATKGTGSPIRVPGLGSGAGAVVVSLACGPDHTVCVTDKGDVYSFGGYADGKLGLGVSADQFTPAKLKNLAPIGQVACGDKFTAAVSKIGGACYWWGQVYPGTPVKPTPVVIDRFTSRTVGQLSARGAVGMFLVGLSRDGQEDAGAESSVYSWGSTPLVLGHGDNEPKPKPTLIEALESHGVIQIAVGNSHAAALTADGRILSWGSDSCGQLGSSYLVSMSLPSEAIAISGYKYVSIAAGDSFTAAVAYEDKAALVQGVPSGSACPAPPPPDEVSARAKQEENELQGLLDQFSIMAHKLEQASMELPPPPPEDDDIPPPPPPEDPPAALPSSVQGKRILPPGSTDLGNGWYEHTDKVKGKKYYEEIATGKVAWVKPKV